jgi:biotin carboxyl carrier protein
LNAFKVTVNGKAYDVVMEEAVENGKAQPAAPVKAEESVVVKPAASTGKDILVNAPLTGLILAIKVNPGDTVKNGQVLLILEALKMENEIVAPQAGVVKEINVQIGKTVNVGDIMLTLRS